MIGIIRRIFSKIFGTNSGCCKLPNKGELTNELQKSYVTSQKSYASSK
jgi:hypothetical protein